MLFLSWRAESCTGFSITCRLHSFKGFLKFVGCLIGHVVFFESTTWSVLVVIALEQVSWKVTRRERSRWLIETRDFSLAVDGLSNKRLLQLGHHRIGLETTNSIICWCAVLHLPCVGWIFSSLRGSSLPDSWLLGLHLISLSVSSAAFNHLWLF